MICLGGKIPNGLLIVIMIVASVAAGALWGFLPGIFKAGMDPFDALKAITINPAEHIGVADRVGSLEVGKDADVVITNGCPFEVMTEVRAVFIDGVQVAE